MRQLLIIGLCLGLGFVSGWIWRGEQTMVTAGDHDSLASVTDLIEAPAAANLSSAPEQDLFHRQLTEIQGLIRQERFELAYDQLFVLANSAGSDSQQAEVSRTLAELIDLFTRELVALRQARKLDEFYERLTLDYPQIGEYQLKLGKLRLQMGNLQAALPPLAQVSNHPQFGAEARGLISRIENRLENSESRISFAEIPVSSSGGQFIVEAVLDDQQPIRLLVDTGAAMTAIDQSLLRRAGYDLNGETQYFSTANGVVAAPVLSVASLSLGEARMTSLSVGALDLNLPGGVAGLLGMNFLRHYEFRIDQGRGVLILDQR